MRHGFRSLLPRSVTVMVRPWSSAPVGYVGAVDKAVVARRKVIGLPVGLIALVVGRFVDGHVCIFEIGADL